MKKTQHKTEKKTHMLSTHILLLLCDYYSTFEAISISSFFFNVKLFLLFGGSFCFTCGQQQGRRPYPERSGGTRWPCSPREWGKSRWHAWWCICRPLKILNFFVSIFYYCCSYTFFMKVLIFAYRAAVNSAGLLVTLLVGEGDVRSGLNSIRC